MSTTMKRFEYISGDQLRVVTVDGEPWFVATDVATVLGHRDAATMTRSLDDDEKGTHQTRTLGGAQTVTVITEAGLYRAILQRQTGRMVEASTRAQVKAFQRWVTHDVLPQIRRTGAYAMEPVKSPAELTRLEILELAMEAERENTVLRAALESATPAIEYHDRFVADGDVETIKAWGMQFGLTDRQAREQLLERKLIYRFTIGERWSERRGMKVTEYEYRPYAAHRHFFDLRPQHNAPRFHNGQVRQTLYVRQGQALALGKRCCLTPLFVQTEIFDGGEAA
ncbi:hypothetical protein CRM73_00365 [Kocuria sp. CCUG 69068]|uniref:BRO family protein n=1 Tax=Kocuria sp. CCUG 69068 TaxID=2043138 RepID=UPI001E2F04EF|nr:hypothetical protein [Kocuria sp. CCUG 69068]